MPSADRFAFLGNAVRNHPLIVASTAATAGVLLGGFVTVQLLATPPRADSVPVAQAVVDTKPAPKSVVETTGSAAAGGSEASSDCDQQTWPRLSRDCMEEYRSKQRTTRVISTDKLDHSATNAVGVPPAPAVDAKASSPAPATPAAIAAAPPPSAEPTATPPAAPVEAAAVEPGVPKPGPASAVFAAPAPSAVMTTGADEARSLAEAKKEKREARKAKRKAKPESRTPMRLESDDDENAVASAESDGRDDDRVSRSRADRSRRIVVRSTARDDGDDDRVANSRIDRSRRIVERWTERDYDVPDASGRGQRRITVIRRSEGGGLFGSLFGD